MKKLRILLVALIAVSIYFFARVLINPNNQLPFINQQTTNQPPNIVFILADDLGWRDLGIYGSTYYDTPNLDALAERGVRFTDAYAAVPICSPTRASILTGQYPGRLHLTAANGHTEGADDVYAKAGVAGNPIRASIATNVVNHLADSYVTLGESFKEAGYSTAYMGKWHTGRAPFLPENNGFDVVVGARGEPGPAGSYFDLVATSLPTKSPSGAAYPQNTNVSKVLVDYAIDFVEKQSKQKDNYFLHLSLYDVHSPYSADPAKIESFRGKMDPQGKQASPTMAAMVKEMDDQLGRLIKTIDALPNAENTAFVFYSDNGGNMYDYIDNNIHPTNNSPLRGGKVSAYEGGVRVPAFVVWPGVSTANTVSSEVITSVDLFPTFMAMIEHPLPKSQVIDGIDIRSAIEGNALERESIFFHFPHDPPIVEDSYAYSGIRKGNWKLLRLYGEAGLFEDRWELYNLSTDIGEQNNLYYDEPEIVADLKKDLQQYMIDTDSYEAGVNRNFYNYVWDVPPAPANNWLSADHLDVNLKNFNSLKLRLSNPSSAKELKVAISTFDANTFDNGHEVTIPIEANTVDFKNYIVPLHSFVNWDSQNRLKQIRVMLADTEETAVVEYVQIVKGKSWGFGLNNSLDGWTSSANSAIEVTNGQLSMDFSGEVSQLTSPPSLLIDAAQTPYLDLTLTNNSDVKTGNIRFETLDSGLSENTIQFEVANNSEPQTIRLDLSKHENWQGIIKQVDLKFDSESLSEGMLNIDSIVFVRSQRTVWGFDRDEDELGWLANGHIRGARASNGTYQGSITGGDPYLYSANNILLDTSEYTKLKFRIKNMTPSTGGEIFFQTTDSRGFAGEKRFTFSTTANSTDFEEITVDMSEHTLWTGEVVAVRIDPAVGVTTGTFEIDDITLLKN